MVGAIILKKLMNLSNNNGLIEEINVSELNLFSFNIINRYVLQSSVRETFSMWIPTTKKNTLQNICSPGYTNINKELNWTCQDLTNIKKEMI